MDLVRDLPAGRARSGTSRGAARRCGPGPGSRCEQVRVAMWGGDAGPGCRRHRRHREQLAARCAGRPEPAGFVAPGHLGSSGALGGARLVGGASGRRPGGSSPWGRAWERGTPPAGERGPGSRARPGRARRGRGGRSSSQATVGLQEGSLEPSGGLPGAIGTWPGGWVDLLAADRGGAPRARRGSVLPCNPCEACRR